jgi:phosphatidate cytidylyltransferase
VSSFDDDRPEPPPAEGVRILGAEEAQAAVEGGPSRARPEEPPRRRRRRAAPPADVQPAARFPLPADSSGASIPTPRPMPAPPPMGASPSGEPSGSMPLPHWTEPPTGEVPMIADDPGDEAVWAASGNQPRFRDAGDWGDADFGFGDESLHDETTAMGSLVDVPEVDDDEVFAAEVAARRAPDRAPARRARPPRATRGRSGAAAAPYPASDDAAAGSRVAPTRDDLPTRLITGAVLAAVALVAFAIGRAGTAVLITVIVAAAAFELFEGFRRAGFQPATLLGLLGSLSLVGIAYNHGERAFPLVSAVVVGFTLFWYLAKVVHARPMVNAAVTIFGFAYVGVLGGFAGLLLVFPDGVGMIIGLVLCAVAYDVVGYFVGSRMGRRPLMPDVSPNKTVEGLIGGMAAAVIVGLVIGAVFKLTPWDTAGHGLLLGIVVAIFAPLGDLVESMLKRDLGLKDFGSLLPGHGGVLDRFDAMLFCLPAVYYLVVALGLS